MSDSDFVSGPWTGFYTYTVIPIKCRTDVCFTFERGRITGEGNDNVGPFIISGTYDTVSRECYWTKTYVGARDVFYRGFREGKGIWGTWEIGQRWRGGFQLWSVGSDGIENEEAYEEESLPSELAIVGEPR